MNLNESNDNIIIFNTPIGYNISEAFSDFSNKDIPKIEYIINQINWCSDARGYQIHIGNHAWSLGLTRGEVSKIITRLVNDNIIAKASSHSPGLNSNGYKIVKPYTIDTSIKKFYSVDDHLFLQKLKADKWIAKGKEHSAFIKSVKQVNSPTIQGLEARIKQLEDVLSENNIEIPPVIAIIQSEPILAPVEQLAEQEQPEMFPKVNEAVPGLESHIKELNNLNKDMSFDYVGEDYTLVKYLSTEAYFINFSAVVGILSTLDKNSQFSMLHGILNNTGNRYTYPIVTKNARVQFTTERVQNTLMVECLGASAA